MSEQTLKIPTIATGRSKSCMGRRLRWLVLVLSLAGGVCFGDCAQAQQMSTPMPMPVPMSGAGSLSPGSNISMPGPTGPDRVFQERRIKALNSQRQKELVSDTNKLLKLTAQLNAQIDRGSKESFTPDQLRMLARIEKLAKSVREKMSNPVQLSTSQDNFPSLIAPAGMP